MSIYAFKAGAAVETMRLTALGIVVLPSGPLQFNQITATSAPAPGTTYLYMDAADGKLKIEASSGTVTTLN